MEPKILRINMNDLSCNFETIPSKYKNAGGRGLTSRIVADEVPPKSDPFGPENKIVIAPGILSGTSAPSSGRLSVGGKSPLTGGIKESNAGGITSRKLARLGVRAVIIEGQPDSSGDWYNIFIEKDNAEIVPANEFANMGLYELIDKLWKKYPNEPGLVGCGIAGQLQSKNAGIFGNNPENTDPGRYAGRGGLGGVLGSKKVIAIITDDSKGEVPKAANPEMFREGRKKLVSALQEHPITGGKAGTDEGALKNYGTNVLQNILNEAGALPHKNFREGYWEHAKDVSGEALHEIVDQLNEKIGEDKNEGMYGHACHPGCIIKCSNAMPDPETGELIVSPLEYETAWAIGTNCAIKNITHLAKLNRMCNDLGLDTIETGCTLAVAMDAGEIPWGDGEAAIEYLKKCYDTDDPDRKLIMSGTEALGKELGVDRIPTVKGQSLPAYDPRAIKGIGVTYATTVMGADHTAGYTIAPEILGVGGEVDPRKLEKAELSQAFQATTAYIDQSGYCLFIAFAILDIEEGMEGLHDTVAGFLGLDEYDITEEGKKILRIERQFNLDAGFTKEDDRLPEFFSKYKLPPHDVTFDVPNEELDAVWNKL